MLIFTESFLYSMLHIYNVSNKYNVKNNITIWPIKIYITILNECIYNLRMFGNLTQSDDKNIFHN